MSVENGDSSRLPSLLDEDVQHFDLASFYRQDEFCDRVIRLEILDECRTACERETAANVLQTPLGASQNEGQPAETSSNSRSSRLTRNKRKEAPVNEAGTSHKKHRVGAEAQEQWSEDIPVSSVILAAKSHVLRTMFTNGMRESDKSKAVLLKVTPGENVAFKEMLHFIYAGTLSTAVLGTDSSVQTFVDLLVVGDKYEVRSLMGAALKALSERKPKVSDTVALALRVPDVLEQHPEIKKLVSEARDRLLETFKDADKWADSPGFLALEEDAVSFLLQSDLLEGDSEEKVLSGALAWVFENRSTLDGRQKAMAKFSRLIRFGCMRGEYLLGIISPEMALPETQERVKTGIHFQAYSNERKAQTTDVSVHERQGMQKSRLMITCNLKMQEDGSIVESQPASWLGSVWRLRLAADEEGEESDSPTVGIFLTRTSSASQYAATKIESRFQFGLGQVAAGRTYMGHSRTTSPETSPAGVT